MGGGAVGRIPVGAIGEVASGEGASGVGVTSVGVTGEDVGVTGAGVWTVTGTEGKADTGGEATWAEAGRALALTIGSLEPSKFTANGKGRPI